MSLYEMLRFYAHKYMKLAKILTEYERDYEHYKATHQDEHLDDELIKVALRQFGRFEKLCKEIGLRGVLVYIQDCREKVKQHCALEETLPIMTGVRDRIREEMTGELFLHVSANRKKWYSEDDLPLFGDEVRSEFPEVTYDISEAGRCYALERWDACVHHLMIATEVAMRKWARDLKIKTKKPLELEDMASILKQAEAKLDRLRNQRRSAKRETAIKYLAGTSAHFGFIKDAWRKPSAHGRERHDERSARSLMNHVEAFMRLLVTNPKPSEKS